MIIYNLLVRAYGLVIKLAAFRNTKAKEWVEGRADWKIKLETKINSLEKGDRIWVHCASYGEFEQGRPLMEAIRSNHPHYKIILSFFSPSGFEAFKNWDGADHVCYLPLDTAINASEFLRIVNPKTVIFIKYEFWVNFLNRLKIQNIPTFLVSAVFKEHHPFFKWYGGIFRKSLTAFNRLFIQDENSGKLLASIGLNNYEVCGDTRFDRVVDIKNQFVPDIFFETFCKDHSILIAGSTWMGDEELLISAFQSLSDPKLKMVLAPHQVDEKNINRLCRLLEENQLPYLRYSEKKQKEGVQILILDTIGLLSKIYHYANVTYIGGGLNSGIHNCLEPTVYLKPVLFFGDDFDKYNEAVELVNLKAAKNIMSPTELEVGILHYLNDWAGRTELEKNLANYFQEKSGTTQKVILSLHLA